MTHCHDTQKAPIPDEIDSGGVLLTLFRQMIIHPQWSKLIRSFQLDLQIEMFQEIEFRWSHDLDASNEVLVNELVFANEQVLDSEIRLHTCLFSFVRYVLSGRINEIPSLSMGNEYFGQCALALYHQYQGRTQEALALYRMVLKELKAPFFDYPFYDMTYILALMADGGVDSKKKLNVLAKKKELRHSSDLLPARLLIALAMRDDMHEVIQSIRLTYEKSSPLVKVLLVLLTKHYHIEIGAEIDLDRIVALVKQDHMKLLQLEVHLM